MSEILRPKLNRIPGGGIALPQAKENHAKDLTTLTRVELLEIKEREEKLLSNKLKLAKLPDKGKRIEQFRDKVLAELDRRANIDEAAVMFSELNIATKAKDALNELEWSGNLKDMYVDTTNDVLDSDDEQQMDPLRLIARSALHEKNVIVLPPETKLITEEDLAEIASFHSNSTDSGIESYQKNINSVRKKPVHGSSSETDSASETSIVEAELVAIDVGEKLNNIKSKLKSLKIKNENNSESAPIEQIEQHVRYLVTKTETQPTTTKQREKFKPYKTTITDVHAPEKERLRKKGKNWEVTAATPPPIQHNSTQMLTLLDSVKIQEDYLTKLKELQEKQAAERLAAKIDRLKKRNIQIPNEADIKNMSAFTTYRTMPSRELIEGSRRINEDDEVDDSVDSERAGGGVTYTVYE